MARTLDWRKRWEVDGGVALAAPILAASSDKENGAGGAAAGNALTPNSIPPSGAKGFKFGEGHHRRQSSGAASAATGATGCGSSLVDVHDADDDALSSISALASLSLRDCDRADHGFSHAAATVAATVHQQKVDAIFDDLAQWLRSCSGNCSANNSNGSNDSSEGAETRESSRESSRASPSARLYRLLDDGQALCDVLRSAELLSAAQCSGEPATAAGAVAFRHALFQHVCRDTLGLPQHLVLLREDRNSRRIIGCLVLLSRCCARSAAARRAMRPLPVSAQALADVGLRAEDLTAASANPNLHPGLQEMQLRGAFWVPDSFSATCLLCDCAFSLLNRRSHCRACGVLCCRACCRARARCLGYAGAPQKICVGCYQQRRQFILPPSDQ